MTPKILIIGASGMLGSELLGRLSSSFQVVGTHYSHQQIHHQNYPHFSRSQSDLLPQHPQNDTPLQNTTLVQNTTLLQNTTVFLDLTQFSQVKETLEKINPEVVLLPAALTDMDRCEVERELAVKINVESVENLVRCCKKRKLVYFSTGAVFNSKEGNYREDDQKNPVNFYAETKLRAEHIVQTLPDHLILRLSMMYSDIDSPKFINRLINNLSEGRKVFAAADLTTKPLLVGDAAQATALLLNKGRKGIYHVAGSTALSCYAMALLIAKKFSFDTSLIHPIQRAELLWKAARAEVETLNTQKLESEGLRPLSFEEGLQKIWEKRKNS